MSQLDQVFAALAHPARRAILTRLADGDANVNELAEPFQMSLPAISKHISVLEKAGLVSRGRNAQFRPCRLNAVPLREVADWTEQYRHIWDVRFDRMDQIITDMKDNSDE